jgi:hypothetical protein
MRGRPKATPVLTETERDEFVTKTAIALAQIEHLLAQDAPKHCALIHAAAIGRA